MLCFSYFDVKIEVVSWPDGRSITSYVEEGRGSNEQSADESQDGVICRLGQQRVYRRWP